MENQKEYNNCTDIEKHIIYEHKSWKKSDCDIAYKFEMLIYWRKRAIDAKIVHLLT